MKGKEKKQRRDAENAEVAQRRGGGLDAWAHGLRASESKLHRTKKRELRAAGVDIFETLAGLQYRSAAGDHDVFRERRAVFHTESEVLANGVMDGRLKEEKLQRLRALEAQKVEIRKAAQLRCDLEVCASVGEKNPRIHEIRLAFLFAGPKRGDEASGRGEKNAGAQKADPFAIPEAEKTSREIWEVHDGIEPASAPIARIGVAGSVKGRDSIAHPIFVVREFPGSHLRVDRDAPSGSRIERVFAQRLIESVREIQAPNVAAAEPAEIPNANAVKNRTRAGILVDDVADGRGPDEEAVVVVMQAGVVLIPRGDKFRGVAGEEEILQIDVAQNDLLMAAVKRIEATVGVLFDEVEVRQIVLDAIAVEIAKNAQSRLLVNKKEAAKICVELLDAGARGDEIVVGTEVVELHFDERFLKADVIVETVGAAADIGAHNAELADL